MMKRGLVLEGGAMADFSIVLMRPEIPHNAGAIERGAAYECYRQVCN